MKQLKRNTAEGECGGESVAKRSQINCTKILCKKPKLERHVCKNSLEIILFIFAMHSGYVRLIIVLGIIPSARSKS